MNKNSQFYLSKYEIWYLLSQNPSISIIGFKNPIEGYLAEDIFPLIQEASYSLHKKDLIYIDQNHKIKITDDLDHMLQVAISSVHTLLVAYKNNFDKKETIRSFNFCGTDVVLLQEDVKGSYLLLKIEANEDLSSIVSEPFLEKMFWAPDSDPFQISEADITLVHRAMEKSNFDEAKAILSKAIGGESSKTHFFETLQSPDVRFSLLELRNWNNPQTNQINGFSVISDNRYIWLLDLVDIADKTVKVSKITTKELKKRIDSITLALLGG